MFQQYLTSLKIVERSDNKQLMSKFILGLQSNMSLTHNSQVWLDDQNYLKHTLLFPNIASDN